MSITQWIGAAILAALLLALAATAARTIGWKAALGDMAIALALTALAVFAIGLLVGALP